MTDRSTTESPISVRTLGTLALSRDGAELSLPPSKKTRALFAYLLLDNRVHRRERLCEIFFDIPDDPRAALRWSISKIRQMLGQASDAVGGDRDTVWIDRKAFIFDFDSDPAADKPTLEHWLERPLEEMEVAGSETFNAWLVAERARIDQFRRSWLERASTSQALTLPDRNRAAAEADRIQLHSGEQPAPTDKERGEQSIQYCLANDGTRIAFAESGSGSPLVKAANWLNHLELDWDSPVWGELFERLSQRHRLVRYDERGNGMSQWDVDDLSFDSWVADLETVVDKVGLDRFPLLGISQGAAVSIAYAARHPERVSKLILIGGYSHGWRHFATKEEQAEREAIITLARQGWGQDNPVYRQLFSQTFMPSATHEELDWFNEFQRSTASADNAVRFLEEFSRIDVRDQLAKVSAPTLVIHSREDQRVPLDMGMDLASAIPGAQMVTIDSDSHLPLSREPAMKRLIEAIESMLND